MDWQDKRIHLYVSICQQYDQKHLWFYTQRMSKNDTPAFTDEEVLTISLFGIMQQHTQIKAIDTYTKDHLSDWFPNLPTYVGYLRHRLAQSHLFLYSLLILVDRKPLEATARAFASPAMRSFIRTAAPLLWITYPCGRFLITGKGAEGTNGKRKSATRRGVRPFADRF